MLLAFSFTLYTWNMNITFYGGAGAVTGSKYLVEAAGKRILLDCGTFQGLSDVRERNRSLPFGPETIDAVIVSHSHLDHIGMLPLLVKRGFTGPIYATRATKDVAEYMLMDAASIETQDALYRAKHKIGSPDERVPLMSTDVPPAVVPPIAMTAASIRRYLNPGIAGSNSTPALTCATVFRTRSTIPTGTALS